MKSLARIFLVGGLVANLLLGYAWGVTKGDVTVELVARKVVRDKNGSERLESADRAKPGEVIEYVATYHNKGVAAVKELLGTLPVPQGMEFIPGTARPEQFMASTDSKLYAPAPLKRRVHLANGKESVREVPYPEYRSLRWDLKELGPGGTVAVSARMKVKDNYDQFTNGKR